MTKKSTSNSTTEFEKAVKEVRKPEKYVLRLYIAGISIRSSAAIRSVTKLIARDKEPLVR
jgi:hypothetical protein